MKEMNVFAECSKIMLQRDMAETFSVVTWNVNSLRRRMERLLAWLQAHQPDVVCLQELKMPSEAFPALEFAKVGYYAVWHGQKTYNGVAILSKMEHGAPTEVAQSLGDDDPDGESRLIAATIPNLKVRVLSVYVPNGQEISSEKFAYKLRWLGRLHKHVHARYDSSQPLVVAGDFNIAPDDRDVYNPISWQDTVICHPKARGAFQEVIKFGLHDALRLYTQDAGIYTYWDYRQLAFPRNMGLRIDHIFVTKPLADRCVEVKVDRDARKGEKPSDHAPLMATFHRL